MSERPVLRVVGGSPTREELAVLAAVVTAAALDAPHSRSAPRVRRGGWNDPAWQHRRALLSGPNAWRSAPLR